LKELEQKKEKQAYVLLPKKEVAVYEAVVADINEDEENTEPAKNEVPVNLLEEKLQLLQKERNDMMGQIFQLENRLKITYLTSLSKVDLEEEEENPIKRLTLYVSMLEGEKQGLNNKIADLSKKLSLAEAGASQIQAKENELTYVKSRLAALEQDKRDVQSQSGEWEVMYKKLYEKTHYLLSAKETELEQLKTNISYLEKDKSRLQERIKDMENELRSTVFNYKGRNPLAFNL
jgi:chaperonin cofactor prefoldin